MAEQIKEPKVFYLCDRRACRKCGAECSHTTDVTHAVHFHVLADNMFVEDLGFGAWRDAALDPPKAFEPVIVCRKERNGALKVEAGTRDVNGWWKVYGHKCKTVTHWMSLPAPPEE